MADRMPEVAKLEGGILLLETSEEVPSADSVRRWVRGLGERGILDVVAGVLVARPVTIVMGAPVPSAEERARLRAEQRDTVIEQIARYNPRAVVCVGVPFGHAAAVDPAARRHHAARRGGEDGVRGLQLTYAGPHRVGGADPPAG